MQTHFTLEQLARPDMARSEEILRKCVHCGFCTATCPTFLLLGDELDSPRGRIYLMKEMLENDRPADARTVKHVDRVPLLSLLYDNLPILSALHASRRPCPAHIQETYRRPLPERMLRRILAMVLPYPYRFRFALLGAMLGRPFAKLLPGRLKGLVAMAPSFVPSPSPVDRPQIFQAQGEKRMRVALMNGCAQKVLDPKINEATIRLLTRHGVEVVVAKGSGCCGALTHHMGMTDESHSTAAKNIRAWAREMDGDGLDHVVINTSGCGTTVKDYGFMFRNDAELAESAAKVSAMTRDIVELMAEIGLQPTGQTPGMRVAYHSACSMQHGQKITKTPFDLLAKAGFDAVAVPESHIAADRRAPTICSSRRSPVSCRPARSRTLRAPSRTSSRPAILAVWCRLRVERRRLSCTLSSYSIGQPADRAGAT